MGYFGWLASIRGYRMVAVNSLTVEAKEGDEDACINKDYMPLNVIMGPGNEHDSKKIVDGLNGKPGQIYVDAEYDIESRRV
jgi:hypothetical protein